MQVISAVMGDLREYREAAFLDVKGAFDGVWWPSVTESLKAENLSSAWIDMVKSYFEDKRLAFRMGQNWGRIFGTWQSTDY